VKFCFIAHQYYRGYPNVLTPAFVVPSSILPHALSLRQLRRRGRAEAARR
jgi:hypothetical protein